MSASVHKPRIAFQGEHGAFSEDAAIELFGPQVIASIALEPCPTFVKLFESIAAGRADYILLPVENSLIGTITPAVQLLEESLLAVVGEVTIRIEYHLIGCPGSVFAEIETVESHPAALAQCKRFLAANQQITPVETDDTAGSVRLVVKRGNRQQAAIAGKRAAELYGGSIIHSNVEDDPDNYTRFLLLARESNRTPNDLDSRGSSNTEPGAVATGSDGPRKVCY